jgi:hypothetical protein
MLCGMVRKEQFAFGAALVASALAFILSESLAWLVLIIGLGIIFDFYLRDLIWGSDRVTREGIEAMPAEEYKQYAEQGRVIWECQNGVRTTAVIVDGIDLTAGLVPKKTPDIPSPPSALDLLVSALVFGIYGIPAGLLFWVLYRAVYFAVRGSLFYE